MPLDSEAPRHGGSLDTAWRVSRYFPKFGAHVLTGGSLEIIRSLQVRRTKTLRGRPKSPDPLRDSVTCIRVIRWRLAALMVRIRHESERISIRRASFDLL